MADIIGSYERLPNDAVRAVAVAKRRVLTTAKRFSKKVNGDFSILNGGFSIQFFSEAFWTLFEMCIFFFQDIFSILIFFQNGSSFTFFENSHVCLQTMNVFYFKSNYCSWKHVCFWMEISLFIFWGCRFLQFFSAAIFGFSPEKCRNLHSEWWFIHYFFRLNKFSIFFFQLWFFRFHQENEFLPFFLVGKFSVLLCSTANFSSFTRRSEETCFLNRVEFSFVQTTFPFCHQIRMEQLDDGWPESVEEQGLLLLVWRHHIRNNILKMCYMQSRRGVLRQNSRSARQ